MRMHVCNRVFINIDGESLNHSISWIDDYIGGNIGLFNVINITDKDLIDSINYIKENKGYIHKYSGIIYFPSEEDTLVFINKLEDFIKNRKY